MLRLLTTSLLFIGSASLTFAQTVDDPFEGSSFSYGDTTETGTLTWWGKEGRTYFFRISEDFETWTYIDLIVAGAGQVENWNVMSSAPRLFVNLRHRDIPTDDPQTADFDGDKIGNADELAQGTDPLAWADLDTDLLPDDWEAFFNVDDPGADPDADTVLNGDEFTLGINPNDPDTDADGLLDGNEIAQSKDPKHPDHPAVVVLLYR